MRPRLCRRWARSYAYPGSTLATPKEGLSIPTGQGVSTVNTDRESLSRSFPISSELGQRPLLDRLDEYVPLVPREGNLIVCLTDQDRLFIHLDGRTGVAGGAEAYDMFGFHLSHLLFRRGTASPVNLG
jgi:hypothetical protein